MRKEVEDAKADLVVWQVGTNDALRHVDLGKFKNCLRTILAWLTGSGIDVVLINPQYGEALVKDTYYEQVVGVIADVAREAGGGSLRCHARASG
jgi:acyl-CoA thioesterase-1